MSETAREELDAGQVARALHEAWMYTGEDSDWNELWSWQRARYERIAHNLLAKYGVRLKEVRLHGEVNGGEAATSHPVSLKVACRHCDRAWPVDNQGLLLTLTGYSLDVRGRKRAFCCSMTRGDCEEVPEEIKVPRPSLVEPPASLKTGRPVEYCAHCGTEGPLAPGTAPCCREAGCHNWTTSARS